MGNLNAEQFKRLADNFTHVANALGDYRYNNMDALTEEEHLKIKEVHKLQLAQATELYTKSAILVLEDAQEALDKIETITTQAQELYNKLVNVQTILNRASTIVNLASAILALDVKAVTVQIQELIS